MTVRYCHVMENKKQLHDPNGLMVDFRQMAYRLALVGDHQGLTKACQIHNLDRKEPFIKLTLNQLLAFAKTIETAKRNG